MSQPITDYQSFFSGALQAIEDTANLKQEEDQLRSEEARTRTELEAEEKKLKADIDRSIKERLNEINRTYDGEISKAKDELKKAQAKREKARNQSVKARIAEETKGPLDEAAEKLRNMKEAFRKQHIHCLDLFFTAILGAPCAKAVGDTVSIQHGHDLVLTAGGLHISASGDVEEGLFLQRLKDGNVPLAGDKHAGRK